MIENVQKSSGILELKELVEKSKDFLRGITKRKNLSILAGAGTSICCGLPSGIKLMEHLKDRIDGSSSIHNNFFKEVTY